MKPAREPESRRPKPCASLKKPHESSPSPLLVGLVGKKMTTVVRHKHYPRNIPVQTDDSRAQGFSPPLARRQSSCHPPSAESGAYTPDRTLPDSPRQCSLPLACRHPPEGHQIGARKRRAPGNTIILSQSYRRRVSADRLKRERSQLTASLEGEPGPTPAGKTLPHSYPETRFRRERARDGGGPQ